MGSLLPPTGLSITIKPIISVADLPECARLTDIALKPDAFHEFKARYNSSGIYQETLQKMTEALHDDRQRYHLFKAVIPNSSLTEDQKAPDLETSNEMDSETIVGFTQWRYGYLEVPKMDPFAVRKEPDKSSSPDAGVTTIAIAEANGPVFPAGSPFNNDHVASEDSASPTKPKPFYSNPHDEMSRKVMNEYIRAIRGKKHVYLHRLVVDPSYQRQGIGQKLLNWGIEIADKENIVAYLNCRPAGYKLYERNGWKVVSSIEVEIPDEDLKVPPVLAMLRSPVSRP